MALALVLAVTISVAALQLYVAPLLPLLTAWFTHANAPGWVKVLMTAGLAFVVAVVTTAIEANMGVVLRWSLLIKFAVALGEAMVAYLGWRSAGVTDRIEAAAPGGVGASLAKAA